MRGDDGSGYAPIGDYAIIGDGRCAALVSRHGSIDWLCLPRFDSASVFGALLDRKRGGRFRIAPTGDFEVTRRYVGPTNVLETTFETSGGVLRVTDAMPIPEESDRRRELLPDHEVLRRVECTEGEVEVEVVFDPRFDYGRRAPRLEWQPPVGWVATDQGQILALHSAIALARVDGGGLRGRARLKQGERRFVSLTAEQGPAVVAALGEDAERRLRGTQDWWAEWAGKCSYEGPFREEVLRSVLLLRLLIFSPSGAVLAAPTTSLPEVVGGGRNWDYRFCWLRDGAMTLRALFDQGITDEGEQFMGWLLHATRLTWPKLQVLYTLYGGTHTKERTLDHLEGYRGSRPVRVGNGAHDQLQVDVYGEVLAAGLDYVQRGGELDAGEAKMLRGLGDTICEVWTEPDNGIWEERGQRHHHTLSKAFCWVGLDSLLKLHELGAVSGVPVEKYQRQRDEIRRAIEENGWSDRLQCYTSRFEGEHLDASLLLLALYGYEDATHERMRSTARRIRERLGVDGLVYRYRHEDGIGGDEAAFGICSFWAVDVLARQGELEEAKQAFRHVLGYANDVGLFSEEIDPATGELRGNFPQAFTHVGLINAANTITRVERGETPTEVGAGKQKGEL